jgi:hypothetical protein
MIIIISFIIGFYLGIIVMSIIIAGKRKKSAKNLQPTDKGTASPQLPDKSTTSLQPPGKSTVANILHQ